MCGIVGFIGNINSKEIIDKLKIVEYRGYDSAGIAIKTNNDIEIIKSVGEIKNLEEKIKPCNAKMGIAHTRWATHGKVSIENAHPHKSFLGNWFVVHNGIIENYNELKKQLHDTYYYSQTDTEIIPNLLEKNECNIQNFINCCNKLSGSFALACINKYQDKLFIAKNKSPLYVCSGKNANWVASDPACFNGINNEYYKLEDGEFAEITQNTITFYNNLGEKIAKLTLPLNMEDTSYNKSHFNYFMEKEIGETKQVIKNILDYYSKNNDNICKLLNEFKFNKIKIIGCGTAYHAGLLGSYYIKKYLKLDCSCEIASEFRYSNPLIDKNTLCIFISQSGETADTITSHSLAKSMQAKTISITNVSYSTLANEADVNLPMLAGKEIGVCATKSYCAQILVFYILVQILAKNKDFYNNIANFYDDFILLDDKIIENIANILANEQKVFFIGRGIDYFMTQEASLKLKEITYINSSAFAGGELKHGVIALIENHTPVITLATNNELLPKILNNALETKSRGANLILFTTLKLNQEIATKFNHVINLPICEEDFLPIMVMPAFQKLAFLVCIKKNYNPDKPRNLAKSVTVE